MKKYIFLFVCLIYHSLFGQTYLHPTLGVNSTYAGACLVNTCSGTYYDNGGAGGNYAANINSVYRTFCPNVAGNCVRATFTSFSMNDTYFLCFGPSSCCDYLTIYNGAVTGTPVLYNNCTSSPGTVTATGPNGCLTFRHTTDGSVQLAGWAATLSCVPCAGGPTAGSRNDCIGSLQVCNDAPITYNATGPGLVSESCSGCSSAEGEIHSSWYVFQIASSGTLGLNIVPALASDDYDFALYGPGVNCSTLGTPIRCSYAGTSGTTGMIGGAGDNSEIVTGDGWVNNIAVTTGQIYYLMVNHWNPPINGYTLDWVLTGGASLNCTPLPVELLEFRCAEIDNNISLMWSTSAEINCDYFQLEKMDKQGNFIPLARVAGSGNKNDRTDYIFTDLKPSYGENYYRLKQVDYDGNEKTYDPTYCNFGESHAIITEINIYDINGKMILNRNTNSNNVEEIMKSIQVNPGMYILHIIRETGNSEIIKFVKI